MVRSNLGCPEFWGKAILIITLLSEIIAFVEDTFLCCHLALLQTGIQQRCLKVQRCRLVTSISKKQTGHRTKTEIRETSSNSKVPHKPHVLFSGWPSIALTRPHHVRPHSQTCKPSFKTSYNAFSNILKTITSQKYVNVSREGSCTRSMVWMERSNDPFRGTFTEFVVIVKFE